MWTLIIIVFGYGSASSAVAIDHVEGFTTQTACVEASKKIVKEERVMEKSFSMTCVQVK